MLPEQPSGFVLCRHIFVVVQGNDERITFQFIPDGFGQPVCNSGNLAIHFSLPFYKRNAAGQDRHVFGKYPVGIEGILIFIKPESHISVFCPVKRMGQRYQLTSVLGQCLQSGLQRGCLIFMHMYEDMVSALLLINDQLHCILSQGYSPYRTGLGNAGKMKGKQEENWKK